MDPLGVGLIGFITHLAEMVGGGDCTPNLGMLRPGQRAVYRQRGHVLRYTEQRAGLVTTVEQWRRVEKCLPFQLEERVRAESVIDGLLLPAQVTQILYCHSSRDLAEHDVIWQVGGDYPGRCWQVVTGVVRETWHAQKVTAGLAPLLLPPLSLEEDFPAVGEVSLV